MKKLNRKLIRGTNWALAGLLSLLGFTGCGKEGNDDGGEMRVEYGVPHATFKVLGRVTNEQGEPLAGVRVVAPNATTIWGKDSDQRNTSLLYDTTYTASDGTFAGRYSVFPSDSVYINMKFEDSATPSAYESDSLSVGFSKRDLRGGDKSWHRGEAKKRIDVKLKRRK